MDIYPPLPSPGRGRRRWWLLGIVVVLVVGGAAGVGYLNRPSGTSIGSANASPITCSLYKYGNAVRLTLEATGTEAECEQTAQRLSGGSGYWVNGVPPLESGLREICALTGPKGSTTAIVEDTSGAIYGTSLCGALAHQGWTTDSSAPAEGPQEQAYNEAKSEEEANAAAVREEEEREHQRQEAVERRREHKVEACEHEAEAAEHREDEQIKEETGSGEAAEYKAQEREYEAQEREYEAVEKCEQIR